MKLTTQFKRFFNSKKAGGLILVFGTIFSLLAANSPWQTEYLGFWNTNLGGHTLTHWINDGLMTIFFLLIGLELQREIYEGELSKIRNAVLPIFAAMGGMIFPAAFFMFFNYGTPTQAGTGIPTATDIAFAIGVLSLLGNKVPGSLKIFLTALAVIDDLGAIIIIAIFYTSSFSFSNLFIALGIYAVLLILNRRKVCSPIPYLIGGVVMWYFMLNSGVHATITGVLIAFSIPFGKSKELSPANKVERFLHHPVSFIILPLFAIANTGIIIQNDWYTGLVGAGSLGIIAGLVLGKPLGIFTLSYLSTKLGIAKLPSDLKWSNIMGVGFLGGIGFTMSIFITLLAYDDNVMTNNAKIAILIGSLIAATIGIIWLKLTLKKMALDKDE